jgi:hypothetical protein
VKVMQRAGAQRAADRGTADPTLEQLRAADDTLLRSAEGSNYVQLGPVSGPYRTQFGHGAEHGPRGRNGTTRVCGKSATNECHA